MTTTSTPTDGSGDNVLAKISHVIFDVDGLLLDTEILYSKATQNVTSKYGKDYPNSLKQKIMGRSGEWVANVIVRELDLPITPAEYLALIDAEYRHVFSQHTEPMPGAERLIRHLAAHRIPIAVCTSSRAESFRLKTEPHREMFALFDHIVLASADPEIEHQKPHPQPYQVCASRFAKPGPAAPSAVLVFEDSIAGVESANSAGMRAIWVPDQRWGPAIAPPHVAPFLTLRSLEHFRPEQFGLPPFTAAVAS